MREMDLMKGVNQEVYPQVDQWADPRADRWVDLPADLQGGLLSSTTLDLLDVRYTRLSLTNTEQTKQRKTGSLLSINP